MITGRSKDDLPERFDTQAEAIRCAVEMASADDLELQIHTNHSRSPDRPVPEVVGRGMFVSAGAGGCGHIHSVFHSCEDIAAR